MTTMKGGSEKIQPLIRWAGSKRKLLAELSNYWIEENRRYVEPFAGSAALFFHLQPKSALLSDLNKNLIGFYKNVKKAPRRIYGQASAMRKGENAYYVAREAFNRQALIEGPSQAVRFLYLNRYCFNGIFRTNMKGKFNVPYGKKTGDFPSWQAFKQSVNLLDRAEIKYSDFGEILEKHVGHDDFVYLDPPYALKGRRVFREYDENAFDVPDLKRLSTALEKIDQRGALFVLSYECCEEAEHIFSKWKMRKVSAQRNVAGFAHHRRIASEYIISNFEPSNRGN